MLMWLQIPGPKIHQFPSQMNHVWLGLEGSLILKHISIYPAYMHIEIECDMYVNEMYIV